MTAPDRPDPVLSDPDPHGQAPTGSRLVWTPALRRYTTRFAGLGLVVTFTFASFCAAAVSTGQSVVAVAGGAVTLLWLAILTAATFPLARAWARTRGRQASGPTVLRGPVNRFWVALAAEENRTLTPEEQAMAAPVAARMLGRPWRGTAFTVLAGVPFVAHFAHQMATAVAYPWWGLFYAMMLALIITVIAHEHVTSTRLHGWMALNQLPPGRPALRWTGSVPPG